MTAESDTDGADADRTDETAETGKTGVFVASADAERRDAFSVRRNVFVDEQGVDEEIEWDEHDEPDAAATHFVAYDGGDAVGAARLRAADGEGTGARPSADATTGKVERVAVAADRRGEDWGRRLMDAVEARAREEGFDRLALHAQVRVREFYERLGYDAYGEEFEEADIPHVAMAKELEE